MAELVRKPDLSAFGPPVFANAEQTRVGRLVHIIGLALGLSTIIPLVHNALAQEWSAVSALAFGETALLAVLWLNRSGRQKPAIYLLIVALLATATLLLVTSVHGFRDVALLVYPSILVVAALLLGRLPFYGITALSVACVSGVVLAEICGFRVTAFPSRTSVRDLIDVIILLLMTAMCAGLLSGSLRRSLARAQEHEAALMESDARMQQLANSTFEGIGIAEEGKIIEVNEQLARMHGYRAADLAGQPVINLVAPESRPVVLEHVRSGRTEAYEHMAQRKDGSRFPVEVRGRLINYRGRPVRVTAVRDITERKQAEENLRRSLAFDDLLNRLLAGLAGAGAADMDSQIKCSLQQIAEVFGVEYAFLCQLARDRASWSSTHEWCAPSVTSQFHHYQNVPMGTFPWLEKQLLSGGVVQIQKPADLPPEAAVARQRWTAEGFKSTLQTPLRGHGGLVNGCIGLFSVSHEVTWRQEDTVRLQMLSDALATALERKRAEEALHQSREQLRALLARLQTLREEERTRISREIHDHLGQLLTAMKLDLRWIERKIGGLPHPEICDALNGKVDSVRQLTDETIESVQKLASELRPGILDRLGLAPAIEVETQSFQSRTGIRCDWDLPGDTLIIPPDLATGAFRIFQEILTNIARHAHATHVTVRLECEEKLLVLEAADNGVGIDKNALANPKSLGLLGMQERAAMLGGELAFGATPGGGTTVTVRLPIDSGRYGP